MFALSLKWWDPSSDWLTFKFPSKQLFDLEIERYIKHYAPDHMFTHHTSQCWFCISTFLTITYWCAVIIAKNGDDMIDGNVLCAWQTTNYMKLHIFTYNIRHVIVIIFYTTDTFYSSPHQSLRPCSCVDRHAGAKWPLLSFKPRPPPTGWNYFIILSDCLSSFSLVLYVSCVHEAQYYKI